MMIVAFRLCSGTLKQLVEREELRSGNLFPKPSILRKLLSFQLQHPQPTELYAPVDNVWINLLAAAPLAIVRPRDVATFGQCGFRAMLSQPAVGRTRATPQAALQRGQAFA
jgi:hypothetical protein